MRTLAKSIVEVINQKGIPVQWQEFGMRLSTDAAISTEIVNKIMNYRTSRDSKLVDDIFSAFDRKLNNLRDAQKLLKENMDDYDAKRIWNELDAQIDTLDINDIVMLLWEDFAIHPFPVVLESLKFNWNYMKENGVRKFYSMTADYLQKMEMVTQEAKKKFDEETKNGVAKPYWLLRSDLLSMEVPMHCDVCRITIAVVIAAKELLQTNFLMSAARAGETVRV